MNRRGRGDAERDRNVNGVTEQIIGGAIAVHRALGPGLLESTYEACLVYELHSRALSVQRQVPMPVLYKGQRLESAYRLDLVVENLVVVELKTVTDLEPIHRAQLLSYLRMSGLPVGLLINFNVVQLRRGVKRLVNNLCESFSASSAPSAVQ